jgi:hypothetical protein
MKKFGLTVSFPEGAGLADQPGFLPIDVGGLVSAETIATGFEIYADAPQAPGESWFVSFCCPAGDGDEVWALAHAAGAYFVAELAATLEDPQEGTEYGPADLATLEALVTDLVDAALHGSAEPTDSVPAEGSQPAGLAEAHRADPPTEGNVPVEPGIGSPPKRGSWPWSRKGGS